VLLAAAVIACIATTSALAATGSLPDPVQRVAERAASRVGIDLPSAAKGARVAKLAPAERSVDAATRRGSTPMARPSPGAPDAKRPLAPKPPKQAKANPVPRAAPTKASSRPHQPKPAKAVGAAANRQDTAKRPVAKPPKERPPKVAAGRAAQ
ncbi:MAG: hypothetical protein JWO69_1807, partial [Thermoleophilia bacterium]|nr:hypothetical protein [Thermoleophilia bacterium]